MATVHSGRRGKPANLLKKGTATTKSHRFESFSQRVVKLKIDPIHRVRRTSIGDDSDTDSDSYFRASLEHWMELNLSENFTQFSQRVNRLCESLPQILHHEDRIMRLLAEYIGKRDDLSMEPLLSLVAQFARDLGQRFERHFASTVTLVASVAATHSNIEVIEWSFTCLAWIFKFLSRLLVPDLRQLLGIMSPYLGKERQKHFVTRFAAESMSFLVRKAALVYYKNKAPLERAVTFLFEDLANTDGARQILIYQQGLMSMFSDAIKGVNGGIHSNGADILRCLINAAAVQDEIQSALAEQVLSGVVINLVHHTSRDTFGSVLDVIYDHVESAKPNGNIATTKIDIRLIFVSITTRKGSRVRNWKRVHQTLTTLLGRVVKSSNIPADSIQLLLAAVVVAVQTSPMDELLSFMRPIMDLINDERLRDYFLPFCSLFSTFGTERFQSVVLPYFQRFITSLWKEYESGLCQILSKLQATHCVTSQPNRPGFITCPSGWKDAIVERFSKPNHTVQDIALLHSYTKLHDAISLSSEPSILPQLAQRLHDQLKSAMAPSPNLRESQLTFARGQGFLAYVRLATELGSLDLHLWSMVVSNGPECSHCPVFLEAVLTYLSACPKDDQVSDDDLEPFATALINNLSGPSHEIRLLSLKILQVLLSRANDGNNTYIEIAIEIEQSELTLHAARSLSMQVRKLSIAYPTASSQKWLDRIIPNFCFGLLSKRLASLWDDACEAIKAICEVRNGETIVAELAMRGLHESSPLGTNANTPEAESAESHISTEFECFNVANVEKTVSTTFVDANNSNSLLREDFESAHSTQVRSSTSTRTQALKVLGAVPQVAEKRSRQFVPLFLTWAAHDDDIPTVNESEAASTGATNDSPPSSWNLRDRKAMLDIFGKFMNPKVLYKASEVHEALLGLLGNGDTDVQKSALKAIFTWKSPTIQPYETNILNIVDDARFRDELSVFVNAGQETSVIKEDHRADLFPVLLRLLYGKIVARGGSRGGQGTQEARRKTILRTISQLSESDFGHFVQISFGPLSDVRVLETDSKHGQCLGQEMMGVRKQYGLLKMVETMLETLKTKMLPFVDRSMNVILYCLIRACRQLKDDSSEDNQSSLIRNIRQTGVHCLDLVFSVSPDYDWTSYMPLIFSEIISPRLENFAVETAQSVSGLLHLFHTWASSPKSALYFLHSDQQVIQRIVDCVGVESAREDVKIFVLNEILNNLISRANGQTKDPENLPDAATTDLIQSKVLAPHVEYILTHVESLLRKQSSRQLTMAAIETLSKLAPFVQSSQETTKLISTATFLLNEPADRVPPKAKSGLLRVMQHFLPLYDPRDNEDLNQRIFEVISSLFDYFKDNPNREVLSSVLFAFANHEADLKVVAVLCADLNAISEKKLDELDFDRRLAAYSTITEQKYKEFTARQWRPLLFNLLYHVKDQEELAIRSSSSFGLKRFIESVVPKLEGDNGEYSNLLEKALLPALRSGAKHPAETVRAEFISIMGYFLTHNPKHPAVSDMVDLLANGDEEASFFNNILHIQQHRRLRALRRLATEAGKGKVVSSNISSFFLPLIEHFVFDQAEDDSAHNLAAETVAAIGVLSEGLEWSQFRAIFRRYKGYVRSRPGMEKNVIRLLGQLTDALSRAMNIGKEEEPAPGDGQMEDIGTEPAIKSTLSKTLPAEARIGTELKTNFIPFLSEFVHQKDESEVHLRVPVAVITVKLLKLLPEEEMALLLPSVLLDLANVLRSRSQDARDMTRKTLADIALILGPSYFGYILRELRSTLTRGYQLHVLSFTVHSILVTTSDHFKPGDLDQNLDALAAVVMDDIFGTVGQEKDAEEYVSKMKEVKSSKSYDSMELLAKISTVRHLSALINPVQALLREKLTATIIKKVDELLRRIGVGLLRNPGAESRDLLIFCYEVIKESYKTETPQVQTRERGNRARFIVNLLNPRNRMNRGSTSSYTYKLSRFGLDVLRSVLNKYHSLMTAANVAGFLPIIGDALLQSYEEVKLSAIRLLSTIIKTPLSELDRNSDVYLMEAIKMIKEAPNTNTEAAQAALKLISSILRERRNTKLKDSHLGYLLKRIAADIEEPDRQGVAFNFIRAVMSRKFIVPEMYELVDNVAAMMVTNHTRSARDLARGVFIHFMIEYPQAKSRWAKQLGFLAKNLDYQHKEGRQSVMEAIHLLLSKTNGDPAQDIVGTFFVPVVMVMSNDDAVECREMAGVLLSDLFSRADSEQLKSMLTPVRSWLEQTQNPLLTTTGLQAIRIFFESDRNNKEGEVRFVTSILPRIVGPAMENREGEEWEVLYHSLQLFAKLCQLFPTVALSEDCANIWPHVCESLFYPHAWIKSCAANLIGIWLADEAKGNATTSYDSVPLIGASGLKLEGSTMLDITRASLLCLKSATISEDLANQTIRNLVFLGRCFCQNNLEFSKNKAEELVDDVSDDSDDEDDIDTATVNPVKKNKPAIEFIFERAAAILRREPRTTRADSLISKTACMKLLAALCTHLDVTQIAPSLQTILLPLLHLTDPSIPAPRSLDEQFQTTYKALISSSQEILDLLQKKLGTTDFVTQMTVARESVKSRREGRRVKRRIEAVADPEKFGREKKRKNDRKREKRKERGTEYQDRRRGW
ncbi:U3 small nucleolar RNA-associated protein 20 [[Emmonsia] crescens]|uniref:U3 small nucleolar RNA-associated protein 20 n=1 Tax=[Emmonsia] crescens TaxID=73230 RepID=A0A2B7ZKR6_9EURO|nr:U3 small nucleolar RNA-associated protein 20 [Emmonsia crescens]